MDLNNYFTPEFKKEVELAIDRGNGSNKNLRYALKRKEELIQDLQKENRVLTAAFSTYKKENEMLLKVMVRLKNSMHDSQTRIMGTIQELLDI